MIRRLAVAALAVAALVVIACDPPPNGGPVPTSPAPSGVRGTVILGPTCPVGGEPGSTDPVPCLTPYSAQLVFLDEQNTVVGRVTSGADGHFEIDLPAGTYLITPVSGDPFPVAQPVSVIVRAGEYLEVQINYDTGIR
ncbi:MAG TPA: hypothetical protein VH741_02470 [Candidatus Limnocylindrales bacterium]